MERVAHQTVIMQYILELAKQLQRDPRSCMPGVFERYEWNREVYGWGLTERCMDGGKQGGVWVGVNGGVWVGVNREVYG